MLHDILNIFGHATVHTTFHKVICQLHYGNSHFEIGVCKLDSTTLRLVLQVHSRRIKIMFEHERLQIGQKIDDLNWIV